MRGRGLTGDWLDRAARRAAGGASDSRRELFAEATAQLVSGARERSGLDELAAQAVMTVSRRQSLKWAFAAALGLAAAPALTGASVELAYASLTDEAIISFTDELLGTEVAGQEVPIFGLVSAAITFYEAADVLGAGEPPTTNPDGSQTFTCSCEPDQICCSCNGACLITDDPSACNSYC